MKTFILSGKNEATALRVGQRVWLQVHHRNKEDSIKGCFIRKIGRKYFYLDIAGECNNKYSLETLTSEDVYGRKIAVYLDPQDFYNKSLKAKLWVHILSKIKGYYCPEDITLDQLKRINAILNEEGNDAKLLEKKPNNRT